MCGGSNGGAQEGKKYLSYADASEEVPALGVAYDGVREVVRGRGSLVGARGLPLQAVMVGVGVPCPAKLQRA